MKLLNAWNFPAIFRDSWVAAFCVTSIVLYYFILLYNDKFIVITNNAHQATLWLSLLLFLERDLTPTWRAIARQLIQKEFWVVFSRIQLPIKLSRLAVCPRQGPSDQPRTQASSRYPSYQRRYGTECDSASPRRTFPTSLTGDARWHFNFTCNM